MLSRILLFTLFFFPLLMFGTQLKDTQNEIQEKIGTNYQIADFYTKQIDDSIYYYVKTYEKETETPKQFFFDENLNEIGEPEILPPSKIQKNLENDLLNFGISYDTIMKVSITFKSIEIEEDALESSILSVDLNNGKDTVKIDDIERSKEEIDKIVNEERGKIIKKAFKIESLRKEFLQNLAIETGIEKFAYITSNGSIDIYLTKEEILKLVDIDEVENIKYYEAPSDVIEDAIINTNIDPWAIDYDRNGEGLGIYMSESGCRSVISGYVTSHFPPYMQLPIYLINYYKIDSSPVTDHSENVFGIIRTASPEVYVYCRGDYSAPTATDRNGYNNNPTIDVETHSWGNNYTSSTYSSDKDKIFDNNVYNYLTPIFVAAGNEADNDWANDNIMNDYYVRSPGKALNVITVGAYDHTNMTQAPFSSFRNSEIGNNKPEISAPGVNITAGGHEMSGTSQATPHAAAMAADLMTDYAWLKNKPQLVKAAMLASTNNNISAYYQSILNTFSNQNQVGVGGIDFRSIYYEGHTQTWTGSNSQYSNWLTNGYIQYSFNVSLPTNANLKIAIAWLNRGDYIYTNKQIGMDFDLMLYDPNGNLVASSNSARNPYEFINYNPIVSGTYTVKIKRFSNNDTNSNIYLSLWVNKDN